jgi:uncharacterized protein
MAVISTLVNILACIGSVASIYAVGVMLADRMGWHHTWWGFGRESRRLVNRIRDSGFAPDIVVGIGRSGAVLGGILAGNLGNVPILVTDRKYTWEANKRKIELLTSVSAEMVKSKKVLLVDAAPHSGETLSFVWQNLERHEPASIRVAVLVKTKYCTCRPHYYLKEVSDIRKMPWRFSKDYKEDYKPEAPK